MKIFCVGLSKTGTTSLVEALIILGFRAAHWKHTKNIFVYSEEGIRIFYEKLTDFDAFADTPIARIFPSLDERFPGSKFILTLRDVDKWKASFRDQFENAVLDDFSRKLHLDLYGTDRYDAEKCVLAFKEHTSKVIDYFRGRERDLLVMDIPNGDGWDKLCPFLGVEVPSRPFPKRFTRAERKNTLGYRFNDIIRNPSKISKKVRLLCGRRQNTTGITRG